MAIIFISYAHDEASNIRQDVAALAVYLRAQDLVVITDAQHQDRPPPNGWQKWMQQSIESADVVLMVCTKRYRECCESGVSKEVAGGRGVGWEGVIICQTLYNARSENHKFFPILPDGGEFDHIPLVLQQFDNRHYFPGGNARILGLIRGGAQTAIDDPARTDQPPPPNGDDKARIQATQKALLAYLHQDHFKTIPDLAFAANTGMPDVLDRIFQPGNPDQGRVEISRQCLNALLEFARNCVDACAPLSGLARSHKASLRARLINAMQQAILLSATAGKLRDVRIQAAYDVNAPCQLEVGLWEAVTLILRERAAEHLRASFQSGCLPQFYDEHHINLFDQIEDGTSERLERLEKTKRGGAETEVCKKIWRKLFPNDVSFDDSKVTIGMLQGELAALKDDGDHLLAIIEPKDGQFSADFIRWLNQDMHLGVVSITCQGGIFELPEGLWRAKLARLYEILLPFETKKATSP